MANIAAGLLTGTKVLAAGQRAKLRAQTYKTESLNTASPDEVIPVITRDGARLRVHAYGPTDSEVIVLAHGWSCSLEYWNPQINAFSGAYRVIAFDQRGHGESESGSRTFSPDQLADDFSDVLDTVLQPGQKAVLVGHSMGGMAIQSWAARYPEQVAARSSAALLVTTAARQIANRSTIVPLLNKIEAAPVKAARLFLGTPVPLPGSTPVRGIFKNRIMNRNSTTEEADFALSIVRSCRSTVRAGTARSLANLDLGNAVTHLTVPTSIIAGKYDKLLPKVHSDEIASALVSTGYLDRYTILQTGHLPNIEATHKFNCELHRVIRRSRLGQAAS